jgi:hypothetical protein
MSLLGLLNQQRRIADLEEQVGKLVRVVGDRDLDWADMRARCKRLLDRTEKARRAIDQNEAAVESGNAASDGETAVTTIGGGRLSDHQKQIQQMILKRRAGG